MKFCAQKALRPQPDVVRGSGAGYGRLCGGIAVFPFFQVGEDFRVEFFAVSVLLQVYDIARDDHRGCKVKGTKKTSTPKNKAL